MTYVGVWGAEDVEAADSDGSRVLYCGVAAACREAPPSPPCEELGIDVRAQGLAALGRRGGLDRGRLHRAAGGDEWVLMRIAGDPAGRVLVYDRNEWECFLDGVKNGEFDQAAG